MTTYRIVENTNGSIEMLIPHKRKKKNQKLRGEFLTKEKALKYIEIAKNKPLWKI